MLEYIYSRVYHYWCRIVKDRDIYSRVIEKRKPWKKKKELALKVLVD